MLPNQITLAIPGDTLWDVPRDLDDQTAGNLLATWTALWDPGLLVHTRSVPQAKPVEAVLRGNRDPSELVLVPSIAQASNDSVIPVDPLVVCADSSVARGEVIAGLSKSLDLDHPLGTELAADFYAFGFAYLQIELLTRSMHYEPQVVQDSLRDALLAAADAALAGDENSLSTHLEKAYDQLMQSRNHYYPIDFYLIDLMLTAPSVAGPELAEACRESRSSNVLLTGDTLQFMADHQADSLAALRDAWEDQRLTVCGGSQTDAPLKEYMPEELLANLRGGAATIDRHLGRRPTVFAHPCGPMAPLVPGVLYKLGYRGAVMADFAGGKVPNRHSTRATWTGLDNAAIEGLFAEPIDAGSHAAMFGLAKKVQHAMNYDLAASLLLVGWPGHRTEWHADLMNVAKSSPILGRPITLDEYFDITASHDDTGIMPADAYPAAKALRECDTSDARIAALARVADATEATAESLAGMLTNDSDSSKSGTLWLNAASGLAVDAGGEVPPFGWRFQPENPGDRRPPRCEVGRLLNEHLELVFDENTGGISATRLHSVRGNHLSQQLVVEPLGPQGIAAGLQLAFDGWQVVESSDTTGTLLSEYRLVDGDGKALAKIRQNSILEMQRKSIEVRVEFDPLTERARLGRIASRIAVRDEGFPRTRGLQGVDLATTKSQVTAAWLGIGCQPVPLAVLCDTPRVHRRHSERMLDTRLVEAAGENTTSRLSYVLDCRYPAQAFAQSQHPEWTQAIPSPGVRQASGWWLHLGANNVQVTYLAAEPLETDLLVRMRLLETAGRPVNTHLAAWQPIADARQMNFLGEPDTLLKVDEGRVQLSLASYEFSELEFLIATPRDPQT